MPEKNDQPGQIEGNEPVRGTVENKAPKPAGLLPKKTQQLVILGVAVVMVLIMWLTGGTKRASSAGHPLPAPTRVQPPNPASVEDFKHSIQQQQAATRQPISASSLEGLEALGLAGDGPPQGKAVPPADAGIPQPGTVAGGSQQQPPDPVKEDRKKRQYLSLFASNVAFTSRKNTDPQQLGESRSKASILPTQDDSQEQLPKNGDAQLQKAEPQGGVLDSEGLSVPSKKPSPSITERPNSDLSPAGALQGFAGKRYVAFEGTVLETLLINRLNGAFSGPVDCLVTTDVYSHDRQHLLIPAGSKVLGEAKKVEALGQQRLAVFFHRVIMPDGSSVSLDQFKGLSQIGETALQDKVNNHYLEVFGASLAVGILGGIAEAGTGNVLTNAPLDRAREGFGASVADSSINILDRFLNVLPTVTIREGHRVKVYLSGDLLLPEYGQHFNTLGGSLE